MWNTTCPLMCSVSLTDRNGYQPLTKPVLEKLGIRRLSPAVVSNLNVTSSAFLVHCRVSGMNSYTYHISNGRRESVAYPWSLGKKKKKREEKEPDLSLRRQNHRILFQQVLHGILDRLSPTLVILDTQNLSRILRFESRVCHGLWSRSAQSTWKPLFDLWHRLGKMCNDFVPQHIPGDEKHTLAARRVKRASAQRQNVGTRNVRNVDIIRRKGWRVGSHWPAWRPI